MFWKFDLNTSSHVDKLLDKEVVSLQELMEEDDLLQECKAQNRRLLDFLCQTQCMEQLVQLITQRPPTDMDERIRFKYPNIACELLTCDVPQLNDKLCEDESLLNILYDFLQQEPPLNPLLASFFSKTVGHLIARKTEQVIGFLRKKDQFLMLVLEHFGTSAMMDLLLRLISCVEPATLRQGVLNWLNEERLIQRLVDLIHSSQEDDRQSNASQTLCDVIRLSRDQCNQMSETLEPDPLLNTLESQQCVEQLLENLFAGEPTECCVVSGTQILLTLLETRRLSVDPLLDSLHQGAERSKVVNSSILQGIEPRLKDFHHLLQNPPKKESILTTIGLLEEPLGNARLHTTRLIAALLNTNTPSINQELCRLGTMDLLLDLFFRYTWNNFLHLQVELCIESVLSHSLQDGKSELTDERKEEEATDGDSEQDDIMVTHLFQKCCLVQRILDAWETNDKIQADGGMRRGNMGHLTRIANTVVHNMEKGPMQAQISDFITELPEDCRGRWESFVEETLTETNRRNTVDLVSPHHLHSSSEDEDIESAFPNEMSVQQAFADYQIQQMTANFVDQFGFNDEEFAEQEDNINAPFDRIAEINFNLATEEDRTNVALFEACCNERIQQFDDEEEDIWEDKEIGYGTQVKSRTRFGVSQSSEDSTQSDLENGEPSGSPESEEEGQNSEMPLAISPINSSPHTPRDGITPDEATVERALQKTTSDPLTPITCIKDLYSDLLKLRKQEIDLELHGIFLSECFRAKIIPRAYRIKIVPRMGRNNPDFCMKLCAILNNCSFNLMLLVIENLSKQLNAMRSELKDLQSIHRMLLSSKASAKQLKQMDEQVDAHKREVLNFRRETFVKVQEDYLNHRVYGWLNQGKTAGAINSQHNPREQFTHNVSTASRYLGGDTKQVCAPALTAESHGARSENPQAACSSAAESSQKAKKKRTRRGKRRRRQH